MSTCGDSAAFSLVKTRERSGRPGRVSTVHAVSIPPTRHALGGGKYAPAWKRGLRVWPFRRSLALRELAAAPSEGTSELWASLAPRDTHRAEAVRA